MTAYLNQLNMYKLPHWPSVDVAQASSRIIKTGYLINWLTCTSCDSVNDLCCDSPKLSKSKQNRAPVKLSFICFVSLYILVFSCRSDAIYGNFDVYNFAHGSGCKVLRWTFLCVCLSVCVCLCVCVCLSVYLRGYLWNNTHDLYQIFCAPCLWLWLSPPLAGWWNPKGKGAVLGVFFPIDNALYSIVFGTYTKTAELIEMPFGMMNGLVLRNSVLCGGDDLRRGRGNPGGKSCFFLQWAI